MRTYVKPEAYVSEFAPSTAIASCESTFDYSAPSISEQTVRCVIHSEERVFGAGNCTTDASATGRLVEVDGTYYFAWQNKNDVEQNPDPALIPTYDLYLSYFGIVAGYGNPNGWHVGVVDPGSISIVDYYTNSY